MRPPGAARRTGTAAAHTGGARAPRRRAGVRGHKRPGAAPHRRGPGAIAGGVSTQPAVTSTRPAAQTHSRCLRTCHRHTSPPHVTTGRPTGPAPAPTPRVLVSIGLQRSPATVRPSLTASLRTQLFGPLSGAAACAEGCPRPHSVRRALPAGPECGASQPITAAPPLLEPAAPLSPERGAPSRLPKKAFLPPYRPQRAEGGPGPRVTRGMRGLSAGRGAGERGQPPRSSAGRACPVRSFHCCPRLWPANRGPRAPGGSLAPGGRLLHKTARPGRVRCEGAASELFKCKILALRGILRAVLLMSGSADG